MPSAGADASEPDLDAALARLSGPELVARLRTTCRRADYDAAARVLADRDRRLAEAEYAADKAGAGLAEMGAQVQALEKRYIELKAEQSRGLCSRCGAIAAAAPRVDRRAQKPPGLEGDLVDLCSSDDDELEEGEFRRPDVAGVSCKRKEDSASTGDERRRAGLSCQRKESASEGEERTPARVSCKRKAPASGNSPDDDDNDKIPLSQLFMKKQRTRAQPGANGQPKKGPGDVEANSAGALGVDRPAIPPSPVNRGIPQAVAESPVGDPKVAVSVQRSGNGGSGRNGGLSRTMPSPPPIGSTAGNSSHKKGSEAQARNGEKQGPVIPPVNTGVLETVAEHMVGSTDDPKTAAFVRLGKNWGLSRTRTAGNFSRKNSSKPNGYEGQVRVAEKQGPVIPPVNRGMPEAVSETMVASPVDPSLMVASPVDPRVSVGNGHLAKNEGLSRTVPSPPSTGFNAGNSSRKNGSKPDGSEDRARIGEKQGPVAGPENDAPIQVRTPRVTDTARRIVGSSRVGAKPPMELKNSSTDGTINMALKSIEGQEKAIGNGTGDKASVVLKDTREQGKPDGQVPDRKVLPRTDGIRGQESSLPSAVTRNWKSSSAVLSSCLVDKELCMQAACALHRQFTTQPIVGGITKYDAHRVAVLVEFLLDGNLQGPLKRTAEDLEKHDSTGYDFLERIVLQCTEQLFSIYRNKNDKYFC